MNTYKRHRFPPDFISYAVWLYHQFNLSHRDIEDLLAEMALQQSASSNGLFGALGSSPCDLSKRLNVFVARVSIR
jgi:hypothetical protein